MSAVTERLSYEDLNRILKSFGADNITLRTIHSFINTNGNCSISIDGLDVIVERITSYFYDLTID